MPRPIRVAAIIGNLNRERGGAQQLLYDVLRRLPDDIRPRVHVLFGPASFREEFEAAGVPVRLLGARSNTDLRAFRRLVRRLREERPRVVHTNSPISGVWGRTAARLAGVPRVVSVEHSVHDGYRLLPRLANALTLPLAHAVVGVSEAVVDSIAGWERALLPAVTEVRAIPNGVDVGRFAPEGRTAAAGSAEAGDPDEVPGAPMEAASGIDGRPPTVGTIGRLIRDKGHDRLLRAWPAVREAVPDARLRIVGDGPRRDALERLAEREGVAGSVTFVGAVTDPVPEYRGFEVAVFPSRREGFGLTAAEAMACGVPVVAADLPALREVVGDAGLLVDGDDPDALAGAIISLLGDADRRAGLAAAGRDRVADRFSVDRTAGDYARLYRRLATG